MISNCGHDENGKYRGGKAGDQSGTEWYIRSWYNYSWTCILRHPSAEVREMIATLAEESANNSHIGYDQNQRTTYWKALKNAGYRPSNITTDCEADCSAGVSANVKATGYLLNIAELQNISENNTTSVMKNNYKTAGFKVLTDKKYLTSAKYLLRGDIILRESKHVCTNLTNGSGVVTTTTTQTTTPAQTSNADYIKKAQKALNMLLGTSLSVDGIIGAQTRKATNKALQYGLNRDYGTTLAVDGAIGTETKSAYAGKVIKKGSRGYLVSWAEIALMLLGYYTSTIEFSGSFGAGMDSATRKFQQANGLSVDGAIGANTINAIISKLG